MIDHSSANDHISHQFDINLEDIRNNVLSIGKLAVEQVENSVSSLISGDAELASFVISQSQHAHRLESLADDSSIRLLALRQPTAKDLQYTLLAIKVITYLERIGEQTVAIARMTFNVNEVALREKHYDGLIAMSRQVQDMLHIAMRAFEEMNPHGAECVIKEDKKINADYEIITRQMINQLIKKPKNVQRNLDIMWSAAALEHIGDHAQSICEHILNCLQCKGDSCDIIS